MQDIPDNVEVVLKAERIAELSNKHQELAGHLVELRKLAEEIIEGKELIESVQINLKPKEVEHKQDFNSSLRGAVRQKTFEALIIAQADWEVMAVIDSLVKVKVKYMREIEAQLKDLLPSV